MMLGPWLGNETRDYREDGAGIGYRAKVGVDDDSHDHYQREVAVGDENQLTYSPVEDREGPAQTGKHNEYGENADDPEKGLLPRIETLCINVPAIPQVATELLCPIPVACGETGILSPLQGNAHHPQPQKGRGANMYSAQPSRQGLAQTHSSDQPSKAEYAETQHGNRMQQSLEHGESLNYPGPLADLLVLGSKEEVMTRNDCEEADDPEES